MEVGWRFIGVGQNVNVAHEERRNAQNSAEPIKQSKQMDQYGEGNGDWHGGAGAARLACEKRLGSWPRRLLLRRCRPTTRQRA